MRQTAGIQGLQGRGRWHLCLQKNDVKRIRVHTAIREWITGTSLVVQWLRLYAPNAGCLGSIPGQGTRSRMSTKDPTTKTQCILMSKINI